MINIESQNAMHSYRATKFHSWHDIHIQKKKNNLKLEKFRNGALDRRAPMDVRNSN